MSVARSTFDRASALVNLNAWGENHLREIKNHVQQTSPDKKVQTMSEAALEKYAKGLFPTKDTLSKLSDEQLEFFYKLLQVTGLETTLSLFFAVAKDPTRWAMMHIKIAHHVLDGHPIRLRSQNDFLNIVQSLLPADLAVAKSFFADKSAECKNDDGCSLPIPVVSHFVKTDRQTRKQPANAVSAADAKKDKKSATPRVQSAHETFLLKHNPDELYPLRRLQVEFGFDEAAAQGLVSRNKWMKGSYQVAFDNFKVQKGGDNWVSSLPGIKQYSDTWQRMPTDPSISSELLKQVHDKFQLSTDTEALNLTDGLSSHNVSHLLFGKFPRPTFFRMAGRTFDYVYESDKRDELHLIADFCQAHASFAVLDWTQNICGGMKSTSRMEMALHLYTQHKVDPRVAIQAMSQTAESYGTLFYTKQVGKKTCTDSVCQPCQDFSGKTLSDLKKQKPAEKKSVAPLVRTTRRPVTFKKVLEARAEFVRSEEEEKKKNVKWGLTSDSEKEKRAYEKLIEEYHYYPEGIWELQRRKQLKTLEAALAFCERNYGERSYNRNHPANKYVNGRGDWLTVEKFDSYVPMTMRKLGMSVRAAVSFIEGCSSDFQVRLRLVGVPLHLTQHLIENNLSVIDALWHTQLATLADFNDAQIEFVEALVKLKDSNTNQNYDWRTNLISRVPDLSSSYSSSYPASYEERALIGPFMRAAFHLTTEHSVPAKDVREFMYELTEDQLLNANNKMICSDVGCSDDKCLYADVFNFDSKLILSKAKLVAADPSAVDVKHSEPSASDSDDRKASEPSMDDAGDRQASESTDDDPGDSKRNSSTATLLDRKDFSSAASSDDVAVDVGDASDATASNNSPLFSSPYRPVPQQQSPQQPKMQDVELTRSSSSQQVTDAGTDVQALMAINQEASDAD